MQETYREVTRPRRIVGTFETRSTPGKFHVETFSFEELGERTKLAMSYDTPMSSTRCSCTAVGPA
jgi:uncharacterized protein YndB with AHSA1/START domain